MTPAEFEAYLHGHIPLSGAMGVAVVSLADDEVVLRAPLAPNINHRETVFGGSASALAILAPWCVLQTRSSREGLEARLVIQRNTMEYEKPILGDFTARAFFESERDWPRFALMLARKGKARVGVPAVLECDGQIVGRMAGEFVALGPGAAKV